MKARPNAAVQRMMVRNSVSRCTTVKINTKKNIMDNRKATGEVLCYCAIIAAFDVLEFDKDTLDRLTAAMNNRADVYTTERAVLGQTRARQLLRERTEPMLDRPFILPAGQYPRKQHEKDALAERRDAGDLVIRYFVEGLNEMGYDRAQINAAVEEARGNYEQFLGWAVDGEYVAYTMLGRKVGGDHGRQRRGSRRTGRRPDLREILTERNAGGQDAGRRNENGFALPGRD